MPGQWSLAWLAVLVVTQLLIGCRGGDAVQVPDPSVPATIRVTSSAFRDGQPIPREYTCRGQGRIPDLAWQGVPDDAGSLALVVSDPDAPRGTFVHWVLYDLPPTDGGITSGRTPAGAREAENSGGRKGWYPPCPPSGTHRYIFTVYALDERVSGRDTQRLLDAIASRAVARGTLTGVVRGER